MITIPTVSQQSISIENMLGTSKTTTIASYGCALTCIGAIAGRIDLVALNKLFVDKGVFVQSNLIYWLKVPDALPQLKFVWRAWTYDNDKVKDWIYNKKFPVIVEVDAAPIGSPKSSHFVVYLGDARLFDPWTGKIRPTSDFPNPKGYILYEVKRSLTDSQFRTAVRGIINSTKVADTQIKEIKEIL